MAYGLTPEQEELLNAELNWFERLGQTLSFLDEYLKILIGVENKILVAIQQLSVGGGGGDGTVEVVVIPPDVNQLNRPTQIASGEVLCPVANTGYKLPGYDIPWGCEVVVKALSTNLGMIRVANSRASAENPVIGYPLIANEAIGYKIKSSGKIWISSTIANEGVHWTMEQA